MTDGTPGSRNSKNARRAAARDKARQLREEQRKRERRSRLLIQGGIGVAILAVLAIVAVIIVSSIKPPVPGPTNMASDGILIGKDLKVIPTGSLKPGATPIANKPSKDGSTVNIVTYVDYLCPYCGEFEKTNLSQIGKFVKSGAATIEIHPIPLLQNNSAGTKYSLRTANAAACVANDDPDSFWDVNKAFFAKQPEEGTAGLSDSQIKALIKDAGAKSLDSIDKCIDKGTYNDWANDALNRALEGPIPNSTVKKLTGTPLVLVNGQQYTGSLTSAADFQAFVLQAQGDKYSSSTPVPTPTATSTPTPFATTTPAATLSPTPSAG
jgi:protein-disulfide isomerase